jgi:DNA (cytosine-5)-methyltransferase 1
MRRREAVSVDRDTINVISLCSGVGGLDLGVELATGGAARVVCHVEREAFAAAILAARMEDEAVAAAPVWSDLRTFDGRPWRGVVDCITAGYPCQPFSFAGGRGGESDPRHLWPQVARIIAEVEPGIVFCENVGGHLSLGFESVRDDLQAMGYRVAAGLFSAAEVGAPHRRERLFILAHCDGDERRRCDSKPGRVTSSSGTQHRGTLAATIGERGRGGCEREHAADADAPDGIPLFPPGPGNRAEWERILRARPDLAPATQPRVRGVDDGMAGRLDRLRACGNGVVPLAAAYAFLSLWACLQKDEQ